MVSELIRDNNTPIMLKPRKPSPVRQAFAERLTEARIAYGERIGQQLNHPRFAALLGISSAAYGYYERGQREPTLETLAKLHTVTGLSLDELIGGSWSKGTS